MVNPFSNQLTRAFVAFLLLSSFIGCDQATKHIATATLQDVPTKSYLGDTIRLNYALNKGGFLSLGAGLSEKARFWVFIGFNVVALTGIAGFLVFKQKTRPVVFIALLLVLGGGVGNLIDRVSNDGRVTDFLNVGIGSIRTGIFNVADVGVMVGATLLVYAAFVVPKVPPNIEEVPVD